MGDSWRLAGVISARPLDHSVQCRGELAQAVRVGAGQARVSRAQQPMLGLVERASGDEEQPTLVGRMPASLSLGDVRSDGLDRPDELKTERRTVELIPPEYVGTN